MFFCFPIVSEFTLQRKTKSAVPKRTAPSTTFSAGFVEFHTITGGILPTGPSQPREALVGGGERKVVEAVFRLEADGDVLRAEMQVADGAAVFAEDHPDYAAVADDPSVDRGETSAAEGELSRRIASVLVVLFLDFQCSRCRDHRQFHHARNARRLRCRTYENFFDYPYHLSIL